MKSVVCNVFGMAMGVACLALVLNRSGVAQEDQGPTEEKRVIVVKTESGDGDVAEALKRALHEKLEGLPEELQKKIQLKLQAVQQGHQVKVIGVPVEGKEKVFSAKEIELKADKQGNVFVIKVEAKDDGEEAEEQPAKVQIRTVIVGPDGEAKTIDLDSAKAGWFKVIQEGDEQGKAIRIIAKKIADAEDAIISSAANNKKLIVKKLAAGKAKKEAAAAMKHLIVTNEDCPEGECKSICIAIAVDDAEVTDKDGVKQITVKVDGGQILLNNKAIEIPAIKQMKQGVFKLGIKSDDDDAKKVTRRKLIIMGEDGQVKTLDLDVDVEHVATDEAAATAHAHGEAEAHAYVVTESVEGDAKGVKKQIRMHVVQSGDGEKPHHADVLHWVPKPSAEAQVIALPPLAKAHADVIKRLQAIEKELKIIRKLLSEMQDEDEDEAHEHEDHEHEG